MLVVKLRPLGSTGLRGKGEKITVNQSGTNPEVALLVVVLLLLLMQMQSSQG